MPPTLAQRVCVEIRRAGRSAKRARLVRRARSLASNALVYGVLPAVATTLVWDRQNLDVGTVGREATSAACATALHDIYMIWMILRI